ncbi:MAG TPA: DNA polymerase I [Candidatus Omnitrophota bacterium]|nr:DNA polymerase I [Candidatus Omnitrophota bacterium]
MSEPRLFLLDAHALCYRSYFAIKNLTTTYGQATNAVYGFLSTLKKILRDFKPDYLAVCFDAGKKTLRQERFKDYKIHRPSMPEDLISQIPLIKKVVGAYHLPIFQMEGFEADDLIATLTRQAQKNGIEVVIVSDDKDMAQLISDRVKVYSSRKEMILGELQARELFGIDPKRIPDYIGLAGDQTDNIPGVLGIGEVTARSLINEFGTLENILSHLDQVKSPSVKEKLQRHKENALLSKELAILDCHVPIGFDLSLLKVGEPNREKLFQIFKELEFKKIAEEISLELSASEGESDAAIKALETKSDFEDFLAKVKTHKEFSFLPQCADPLDHTTCARVVLALKPDDLYLLAIEHLVELKPILEDPQIIKITHDIKQCWKILHEKGCFIKGKIFDVMLAGYLLNPAQGSYSVENLAWVYLKDSNGRQAQGAKAAGVLLDLYPLLLRELKEKSLLKLFEEIEMPLAYVLFRMETEGVRLDEELLQQLSIETGKKIDAITGKIHKIAAQAEGKAEDSVPVNLNSPKQLSVLLFEKLKLPVVKKTKTGFSTDEGVLTKLAEKFEIASMILEFRQLAKLKSTYIDALPKMINPKTGRIHAYFNQTGTETGRLSSLNPNLQNIPIRTELGREIRKAFIPLKKDHMIISADYSQIELRILGHLSGDQNLKKAFEKEEDIHTYTAALILDVKEKDITPQMRNSAKRVNFGIIYGMSAFGLAKDLSIPQEEAQTFIDKYFLRYPAVKMFMDNEIKKANEQGFVLTILNRRRYLPEIKSGNQAVKQFAERQAINTPVQGSAADLMKLAMINIQKELERQNLLSRLIITVHDELVFDVPKDEIETMIKLIRRQMENSLELTVPVKVTIKTGSNWLQLKEVS